MKSSESPDGLSFSLVRGDPWFRFQQAIGLIPSTGLGIVRRSVVFALVTWVPLVIWAILWRRAFPGELAEPLLQHLGIHARCLLAIPLLIISEAAADRYPRELIPYFLTSGLVQDETKPKFESIISSAEKMRDSWVAWGGLLGITLFVTFVGSYQPAHLHDVAWAHMESGGKGSLGFGGWWYLVVVRSVFTFLLIAWAWRLVVCSVLLWRISRLDLQLVPTHPDGAGGLGFLEDVPIIFSSVVLAMSVVMASRWEHDVLYHGAQSTSFNILLAVFVAIMFVLFLSPLAFFSRCLRRLKQRSLLDYGALVGQHGRLVRRRWITGKDVKDVALLQAPELGPVSDTVAMYEVVDNIRIIPIGKRSLLAIGLPALLPMLPLWAIDIPLKELVPKLLEALI
jgi:hypothetical protein